MELENAGGVEISLMFTSDSCSKLIHSPYKSSATLSHLLVKVCLHVSGKQQRSVREIFLRSSRGEVVYQPLT